MKLNREELQQFFSIVDLKMAGNYHKYYQQFGVQKGSGANFKCWNVKAHARGDSNPSMSIMDDTGVHNCFGCGLKGNFQTFWKSELKDKVGAGDYVSFMVDLLNLNPIEFVKQSKKMSDDQSEQLKKLYDEVTQKYQQATNKPFILNDSLSDIIKESTSLDKAELEEYVSNLLASPTHLEYLKSERNVTQELIKKYKIGLCKGSFVFPMINGSSDLVNMKMYNPLSEDSSFKWWYKYSKNGVCPTPMDSLTRDTIYFFEGEPDTYCALGFGIDGAITLGSKGQSDVVKAFGADVCKRMLAGKEIVIVMDADEASEGVAEKLAKSIYQFDIKQIKIINLNKSDINPNGLDPSAMKTVKRKGGDVQKRSEKDFTEFMKKNGFNDNAKSIFMKLVSDTPVYTQNIERLPVETFKVTLQESRSPKYFSHNGLKRIEVSATICDFDESAFLYDKRFGVSCVCMGNPDVKLMPACRRCMLPTIPGFDKEMQMVFNFLRSGAPTTHNIVISANDMLSLIETNNKDKTGCQKSLCGIDQSCRLCKITPDEQEKVLHVRLSREVSKYGEMLGDYSNSDIQVDAYIIGEDVYPGKSYKMRGVQTKDPGTQKAVLVIDDLEPIATSIDNFKMDQSTHEVLKVFKKKDSETIEQHLNRRYNIFGADAGVTGRHELFELMDYSFFSQVEVNNKLFPSMRRGWVETLIVGESRSAKTMIAKFLMSRYRIGEMLSGSSAVTRSGLLGGVKIFRGRQRISWGAIPINDSGIVIIDELSNVSVEIMNDMTASRSDGIIRIDSIEKGSAPARTRKIMLSNPRGNEVSKRDIKGVDIFLNVCVQRQILSRFDAAIYIMSDDVVEFDHSYVNNSDEFSEYQCNILVMWVYSRRPEDVVYEDGIEDLLNECQEKMLEKYHRDTQLVNQEFRLKLLRMAMAVAGMLYSTPDNDWNKLYVKKEHVMHVMRFLDKIYCYPNMRLDEFSRQKKRSETLGDMRFMENILKYISIKDLINENEFTQAGMQQVFYDYLDKVQGGRLFMVDAKTDKERSTRVFINLGIQKLIATLVSRNCLIRRKYNYRKTEQFANWLLSMEDVDEREFSDILEPFENQQSGKVIAAFEGSKGDGGSFKKPETRKVGVV
jgi:hypothetical protein